MESAEVIACSKIITMHMLQSRQPTTVYNPHKGIVNCVHINHTSKSEFMLIDKVIASCGQDGRIVLVNAMKPDNEVFETAFHNQSTILQKPISINCIMFSSQSHYIAAGSNDCLIKIWDMKNHKQVYSTIKSHVASVNSLGWIKNLGIDRMQSDILASASSNGDIFLHSVKTSNIVANVNTKNQESINQIKISESEGHCRMAACTSLGSVLVWNLRSVEKSTEAQSYFNNGKKSSITSISFSSFNPVLLASSSMDETLTFYDINEKKSVKVITSEEPLTTINFHSDGHTLVAGGMYGALFIYDLRKPTKPREKLAGHDSAIKHTVLIKEYEPSKQIMAGSRASNSSSAYSANSTNLKGQLVRQINPDLREPQVNNFINSNFPDQKTSTNEEDNKRKEPFIESEEKIKAFSEAKLSTTGQEAIKNAENKSNFTKISSSIIISNEQGPYSKSNLDNDNQPKILQNPVSKPPLSEGKPSVKLPPFEQSKPQQNSINRFKESSIEELREIVEERFENLHMELIHQFHLQHRELKEMIKTLIIEDKKKTEKIKELENQIIHLKNNTY